MKIRKAKSLDLPSVNRLLGQLNHPLGVNDDLLREAFEGALKKPDHLILVVEDNNDVVGYVSGHIHMALYAQQNVAYIDEIVIQEEKRSSGIGTALMEAFEQNLVEEHCVLSALATSGAIKFYEGLGYSGSATYLKKPLIDHINQKPNKAVVDNG